MSLRCLFVVQGEGRGHLTQALALKKILANAGHEVPRVLLGRNPNRKAPPFFLEKIGAPVERIDSPSFFMDGRRRAMATLGRTILKNVPLIGRFREGLRRVDRAIEEVQPDVVINFHEVLAGVHYALRGGLVGRAPAGLPPLVCVAHQYLFQHPAYPSFPEGAAWDRWWLRFFVGATQLGATKRLALSLYPTAHRREEGLVAMPPLLREKLTDPPSGDPVEEEPFFLIYLLNSGYAEEVIRWHRRNPGVRLHCFWGRPGAADEERYDDTLTFHALDDEKFLSMMKRCRGLATTAGFESVGEALYLGTPVLMVPVEGHFEQRCNAVDGQRAGAGVAARSFETGLSKLRSLTGQGRGASRHAPGAQQRFRRWVDGAAGRFVREIEEAARAERASAPVPPPEGDGVAKGATIRAA
ncbi:MAG: glycosyltransferase [Bacteroidetes bacterium QS_9_68_14]|nr:MAG: glycosyltransferase [Bacteroidetes bacterium QS_9_68_14]